MFHGVVTSPSVENSQTRHETGDAELKNSGAGAAVAAVPLSPPLAPLPAKTRSMILQSFVAFFSLVVAGLGVAAITTNMWYASGPHAVTAPGSRVGLWESCTGTVCAKYADAALIASGCNTDKRGVDSQKGRLLVMEILACIGAGMAFFAFVVGTAGVALAASRRDVETRRHGLRCTVAAAVLSLIATAVLIPVVVLWWKRYPLCGAALGELELSWSYFCAVAATCGSFLCAVCFALLAGCTRCDTSAAAAAGESQWADRSVDGAKLAQPSHSATALAPPAVVPTAAPQSRTGSASAALVSPLDQQPVQHAVPAHYQSQSHMQSTTPGAERGASASAYQPQSQQPYLTRDRTPRERTPSAAAYAPAPQSDVRAVMAASPPPAASPQQQRGPSASGGIVAPQQQQPPTTPPPATIQGGSYRTPSVPSVPITATAPAAGAMAVPTSRPAPTATITVSNTAANAPVPSVTVVTAGGPPVGGDWVLDEESGYYWSDREYLYYDAPSGTYYDPNSNMWFDPVTQQWS